MDARDLLMTRAHMEFLNSDSSKKFWAIAIPLLIFLLGINPYLAPKQYDDILYYLTAEKVSEVGSYYYGNVYDFGWAPILPYLLAIPFVMGAKSVWTAKIVIIIFALLGLLALHRLFRLEKRPYPNAILFIFAVSPQSLLLSSRVLTEWPYIFFSTSFLIMLHLLNQERRTIPYAILTGLLLTIAILTRYVGTLLFIAVIAQMALRLPTWKAWYQVKYYWHEIIVFTIGILTYFSWKLYLEYLWLTSTEEMFNFAPTPDLFQDFSIPNLMWMVSEALGYLQVFRANQNNWLLFPVMLIIILLVLAGIVKLFKDKMIKPSDIYVFLTLFTLSFYEFKLVRYMHPITPFLVIYLVVGFQWLFSRFLKQSLPSLLKLGFIIWVIGFLALDGALLLLGNKTLYNGINYFVSPTSKDFYVGKWRDLYLGGEFLKSNPTPGVVAETFITPPDDKYLKYFSNRELTRDADRNGVSFLFVEKGKTNFQKDIDSGHFEKAAQFGDYTIYSKKQ